MSPASAVPSSPEHWAGRHRIHRGFIFRALTRSCYVTPGRSQHISAPSPTSCCWVRNDYFYYFYPCCYRQHWGTSCRYRDLTVCKSLCAQILSENSSPRRNLCLKPKENRWEKAEMLVWGGQGSPSPWAESTDLFWGYWSSPWYQQHTQFMCTELLGCTQGIKIQWNTSWMPRRKPSIHTFSLC